MEALEAIVQKVTLEPNETLVLTIKSDMVNERRAKAIRMGLDHHFGPGRCLLFVMPHEDSLELTKVETVE